MLEDFLDHIDATRLDLRNKPGSAMASDASLRPGYSYMELHQVCDS